MGSLGCFSSPPPTCRASLVSTGFAISVVSSEGAAVDRGRVLSCCLGTAAPSLPRARNVGWDQKKPQRFSSSEPSCVCLLKGGLWGVPGTKRRRGGHCWGLGWWEAGA